jgi:hypothetical protein
VTRPVFALLRLHTLDITDFQAILLFLRQNPKYGVHILAYLSRLNIGVRPHCKSGLVSGDSINNFVMVIFNLVARRQQVKTTDCEELVHAVVN